MAFSPQQEAALRAIRQWQRSPGGKQVFRLFGYAGSGKTTLARTIANDTRGQVAFGAFTGKASLVLQSKGCHGARTLHSLMYTPAGEDEQGQVRFELNPDADLNDVVLFDESACFREHRARHLYTGLTRAAETVTVVQ